MGSAISSLIESIENKAEKEKLANDALNSLIELATMQQEAFYLKISNPNFDPKMIPIEQVINKDTAIQANVSTEPAAIGDMIKDTFSAFASGDVATGIAKLVGSGLKILMGTYSGNQSMRDTYVISTGALGGVYRVDMHFFAYRYQAEQLTSIVKQVVLVSLVVSAVNLRDVKDNTLRVIVQNTYGGSSTPEEMQKIYEQLKLARDTDNKPSLTNAEISYHFQKAMSKINGANDKNYAVMQLGFNYETAMGQAAASIPEVKGFVLGAISAHYEKHHHHHVASESNGTANGAEHSDKKHKEKIYSLSVLAEVAEQSTSGSVVDGEVSLKLKIKKWSEEHARKLLKEFDTVFKAAMDQAMNLALSDSNSTIKGYHVTGQSISNEGPKVSLQKADDFELVAGGAMSSAYQGQENGYYYTRHTFAQTGVNFNSVGPVTVKFFWNDDDTNPVQGCGWTNPDDRNSPPVVRLGGGVPPGTNYPTQPDNVITWFQGSAGTADLRVDFIIATRDQNQGNIRIEALLFTGAEGEKVK